MAGRTSDTQRTRMVAASGLGAALLAVSASIVIPLQPVPITLQLMAVALLALFLPPRWAAAAAGVYLLAGAIGLPVFSQGRGGLAVLAGPTGGYLLGFLLAAFLGAGARRALEGRIAPAAADAVTVGVVLVSVYACGFAQLLLVSGMTPAETFLAGVAPFLVLDVVKVAGAVTLAAALRKALAPVGPS